LDVEVRRQEGQAEEAEAQAEAAQVDAEVRQPGVLLMYEYLTGMGDAERASELFEQAMRQFEAGHYNTAAQNFLAAYREEAHPNMLWNAGNAYERAGGFRQALEQFERYLADIERRTWTPRPPASAAQARDRIATLRGAIAEEPAAPGTPTKGPVERVVEAVTGAFSKRSGTIQSGPRDVASGGKQVGAGVAAAAEQTARETATALTGRVALPSEPWYRTPVAYVVGGIAITGLAAFGFWYIVKD
jgi:tetratricopeptide (TPR) repeat protein